MNNPSTFWSQVSQVKKKEKRPGNQNVGGFGRDQQKFWTNVDEKEEVEE